MVPIIEEFEACKSCGYKWSEWKSLSNDEKVESIALNRASRLIELHSSDASNHHMEQELKKSKAKGRRGR